MIVHVTQRHIDEAIEWRKNRETGYYCSNCPIGRAAGEVLIGKPGYNGQDLFIELENSFDYISIGEEAEKFARDFGRNTPLSPFSFEVPDKYAKSPV